MKTTTAYIFRLTSSRGTDIVKCFVFPERMTRKRLREISDRWAELIVLGSPIDSYTVSVKRVSIPSRNLLLQRYQKVCKSKQRIESRWKEMAQMLNPSKVDLGSEMMSY